MRKFVPRLTALLALSLSGFGLVTSCQKEAATVQPQAPATATVKTNLTAWNSFLESVKHGQAKDPIGQYVSDNTVVVDDQLGSRPARPKVDMQLRDSTKGFTLLPAPTGDSRTRVAPCGDPVDCGGGGGGLPPAQFYSSEAVAPYSGADNPNGYIWDVKISIDPNSGPDPSTNYHVTGPVFTGGYLPGYTRIPANLNEGAGGYRFYLTFTRDPSKVKKAYYVAGLTGAVTGVDTHSKCCFNSPYPDIPAGYDYIWAENDEDAFYPQDRGTKLDLNADAGGNYVYAYQSKDPAQGTPIEIGVLVSDYSSAQPPAGWTKIFRDLNDGAGGKFIYFCYKHR